MNEHEKQTLDLLSATERENTHGGLCACDQCRRLIAASEKTEIWFNQMRQAQEPAYLQARVKAALRPQNTVVGWLRLLVPAGAFTAAALCAWMWLVSGGQTLQHPIDDLVFIKGDGPAASTVASDNNEPVAFLKLEDADDEDAV